MKEEVNKNVKSKKNILDYLKSLKVDSINEHEEFDFLNYVVGIVKVSLIENSNTNEYIVYLLVLEKLTKNIYNELLLRKYDTNKDAEYYYMQLRSKVSTLNEQDIVDLILTQK